MPEDDIGLQPLISTLIKELDRLNATLESFKAPPQPPPPIPPNLYLSGTWHRRDGDGYGIVPRPGVHDRAYDQTRHLRSTHLR